MTDQKNVVLSVRHLKQYFKTGVGKSKLVVKAVDDVSFDVYKGEVFSLVGESGCGKTTTGRSIIRLYEPTDGEVYFQGVRVGSGTMTLTEGIKKAKKEAAKLSAELKQKYEGKLEDPSSKQTYEEELKKIVETKLSKIQTFREEMRARRQDNRVNNYELMKKMQMIFQDPIASLNPRMTVKEIIAEGLRIGGERNNDVIIEKVNKVLETVGLLPEHASRYPHEFSGGQRQRIGIARALVVNPDFIIADEPISALDVSIRAQVINLLNDLRNEFGITIMFIAHDLSVVKYFSDRVAVMYFGKMVELAPKDELFANPKHPYTISLLSSVPHPDPRYEKTKAKRIRYNPSMHDYSVDKPSLQEIKPGHFVYCNSQEFQRIQKELSGS
jgi:oligopeptide transport system ATP-binding protein